MSTEIRPYRIEVPQADVDDLRERLHRTRWGTDLPGQGWSRGVPVDYLKGLAAYWADGYDWRAAEARLNELPQFVTEVHGQPIHFAHVRSANPDATPLLMTHDWPASFVAFTTVVEKLTDRFHLVLTNTPGVGFGGPLVGPGWNTGKIAGAFNEIMDRLGYDRYGVQGGDVGASVSPEVARVAPDAVVGVHLNGNIGMPFHELGADELASLTDLERDRLRRIGEFMQSEFGYISIQGTRPATLGAALADSPVGQLAWIVDKLRAWTFPAETPPEDIIGIDRLLTDVMLYWLTDTSASSAYVGYAQDTAWGEKAPPSGVPTAVIVFAHDVGIRRYAEQDHTIVRWTDVQGRGGHFAALEEPELLLDDVRTFFRDLRRS